MKALSHTLSIFDVFHGANGKADVDNAYAKQIVESWANAEWFTNKTKLADKITATVFKVPGETNTDDLLPYQTLSHFPIFRYMVTSC